MTPPAYSSAAPPCSHHHHHHHHRPFRRASGASSRRCSSAATTAVVVLFLLLLLSHCDHTILSCHAFQHTTSSIIHKQQQQEQQQQRRQHQPFLSRRLLSTPGNDKALTTALRAGGGALQGGESDDVDEKSTSSIENTNNALKGRGLLCLVALLYGTLNVSLRLVYQLPEPPSAAALATARGWLASLCFVPLLVVHNKQQQQQQNNESDDDDSSTSITASNGADKNSSSSLFTAGAELAVWNFLAQGLLTIGLLSTGSARASFLTQTSVLFTPILSMIFGREKIPRTVWMGCGVALAGLTLLSGGATASSIGSSSSSTELLSFSQGDWIVLGGALSWSAYLFRLPRIGSKLDEIPLQAMKTLLLAVLYSIWLVWSIVSNPAGATSFAWATYVVAWGALLYSAFGPGTLADVLQQQGQQYVSASEANVLLSMEPVFAALCAWLLLGEVTSLQEGVGGGLILVAALIATRR